MYDNIMIAECSVGINKSKKFKGFTLVEIIVVLVILAVLAVAMIPALTGYIDKANEKTAIAEARNVVTAAQTLASEKYALGLLKKEGFEWEDHYDAVLELADLEGKIVRINTNDSGKVTLVLYTTVKGYNVTYNGDNGMFSVELQEEDEFDIPVKIG